MNGPALYANITMYWIIIKYDLQPLQSDSPVCYLILFLEAFT